MSIITSHGLAQESWVLTELSTTYEARLEPRGVSKDFLSRYKEKVSDMVLKRTLTGDVRSNKKQLTGDENTLKADIRVAIRCVQKGVKKVFPSRSPQRKEFHIGSSLRVSTPKLLGYADDVSNAFTKYADVLIPHTGIIVKDIERLKILCEQLKTIDTKQELAKKKDSPEATNLFAQAMNAVLADSDLIHTVANAEFVKEPELAKQFANAKKLRYAPEPRKPKQEPATPPEPPAPTEPES